MSRNAKRQRETVTTDEVMRVDAFVPDYESTCANCGMSPTVVGVKNGKLAYSSGLCGVCTWGQGDCVDPANW